MLPSFTRKSDATEHDTGADIIRDWLHT